MITPRIPTSVIIIVVTALADAAKEYLKTLK